MSPGPGVPGLKMVGRSVCPHGRGFLGEFWVGCTCAGGIVGARHPWGDLDGSNQRPCKLTGSNLEGTLSLGTGDVAVF